MNSNQNVWNFPVSLAPMVGLTHVITRMVVRSYLPQGARTLWPTEMLNSRRLPHEKLGQTPETIKDPTETDLVPQILGNEEEAIADSVVALEEWGAIGIDINMGCPVQKALRHNYGVALMGDPVYAAEVVGMAVRHTKLPVSVKLRAGDQSDPDFLQKFSQGLVQAGASWLCLHPRTAEQKRRGSADWNQVRDLKKILSVPLIGNGDIQTYQDVLDRLEQTSCDGIMVGRALMARPWLLWQVGHKLGWQSPAGRQSETLPWTPEEEGHAYGQMLLLWLDFAEKYLSHLGNQDLILRKFRFFLRTNHVWLPFGHSLVGLSTKAKSLDELKDELEKFFQKYPMEMSSITDLRQ
jgi:tRNA-dihydrouridine synthase B